MIRLDAGTDFAEITPSTKWAWTPGQERAFSFRLSIGALPASAGQYQTYFHMRQEPAGEGEALDVIAYHTPGRPFCSA